MAIRVEGFNVNVFHGWADIGEAPGDSLVVSHDYKRNSGKRDPGDLKAAAAKMGLVPQIRHLVPEMHVIGEQRLARNCVRSRDNPVVGPNHHAGLGVCFLGRGRILK